MKLKYTMISGILLFAGLQGLYAQESTAKNKAGTVQVAAKQGQVNPHFVKASELFNAGNMAGSAAAISAGADQIRTNLAGADKSLAADAMKSAKGLDRLASRVKEGTIKDAATLNTNFAKTSNVMAKYHSAVAKKAIAADNGKVAAPALSRTADYIENGAKWSGTKLGDAGKGTVTGLRNASGSIVNAGGTIVEGTGNVLGKGIGLITGLGRAITGQPKAPETKPNLVEKAGEGVKKAGKKIEGEKKDAPLVEEPKK